MKDFLIRYFVRKYWRHKAFIVELSQQFVNQTNSSQTKAEQDAQINGGDNR